MKHLLTLLLLLPAFCTATAGGTNIPGAILAGARTTSAPAGAINTGEETLQRLQLLACTEDELLEGYPEDRVDYSVKLRNPNAVAVTGELSLELFDTAGNYIGAPAGACKTITLEAGEEQTANLILFLPPSGEERRVSICFTPFEDTPSGRGEQYSFGYFDMRSKTVAEGAPRLSLVSAEPATPRFAAGGKAKAKVTIKNTGGYFSNTSYSQSALEYVILAKKINLNGTNLTNIPLYETESLGDQPVRIDKDETATVEIELARKYSPGNSSRASSRCTTLISACSRASISSPSSTATRRTTTPTPASTSSPSSTKRPSPTGSTRPKRPSGPAPARR